MKKKILYSIWAIFLVLLVACSSSTSETGGGGETVLEVVGFEESKSLTMQEMKDLPVAEGWGGIKNSAGNIFPAEKIKGVMLTDLLDLVGGFEEGVGVRIVAKDGYAMTMSYDQVTQGDFITYDPGTGDENEVDYPMRVVVAYERAGEPIPADDDGPLRLFIIGEDNGQVVDGHWTVKWVSKVEL